MKECFDSLGLCKAIHADSSDKIDALIKCGRNCDLNLNANVNIQATVQDASSENQPRLELV